MTVAAMLAVIAVLISASIPTIGLGSIDMMGGIITMRMPLARHISRALDAQEEQREH